MENSYQELIRKCIQHDRKSQELLYHTFSKKMYGVCLGYAKDKDEAKDILQEGFIKVFANLKKYTAEGNNFEGWIRRVIVNTAIDHYRKSIKEQTSVNIENIPDIASSCSVLEALGAKELVVLIEKLPEGARIIFNLYVVEGYTHKEIAEIMNISEGTSKSQLSRGKQLLQGWLNKIYSNDTLTKLY